MLIPLFLVVSGLILVFSAAPTRAQQDASGFPSIIFESYTYGGQTTQLGCGGTDCPAILTGATVDIRVIVDLFSCDPVTIYFGGQGAGSQTVNFGGSFAMDFQHTYTAAGVYPVEAIMPTCPGSFSYTAPLSIGGSGSPAGGYGSFFGSPVNSGLVYPAIVGFWLGLIALIMAASAGSVGPAAGVGARGSKLSGPPHPTGKPYIPFTQPHLEGLPYLESTHVGSLSDIPPGAQRIDPGRIPFNPGTPTDIGQAPQCPAGCGDLIYTSAGWFSPNPSCPLRNTGTPLTAFPKIGEFYG
jgi:hypothetical protein